MMKYVVLAFSFLAATPALAQQLAPADIARAAVLTLQVDKNNLETALVQVQRAVEALVAQNVALEKHQADLDAYLHACGDKSGCTQPANK